MNNGIRKRGRVLFIIHDLYQNFNQFPLGVAYMATSLRNAGHEVQVYCQDLNHHSNETVGDFVASGNFDIVGIGFLAARFNETVRPLCDVVNRNKKGAWLVLGGHGPSPIPEYTLRSTSADFVVVGEGEQTIVELLENKLAGKPSLEDINGISWMQNGECRQTPRRGLVHNLDSLGFPAWDLFPTEQYARSQKVFDQPSTEKSLAFISSRGCINACTFCYRMEKGVRVRSIANVVEELKILRNEFGIRYFFIQDEMFVLNRKRLVDFENELEKNGLDIRFSCDARVDILDRDILKSLKRCGCIFLNFGIESADDNVLRLMKKNCTVEQNTRAVEMTLEEGGIGLGLNILWGCEGDSVESLWKGVGFIKKYNTYKYIRTIRPPTPYPGSELYYRAIEMKKLSGPDDFFEKFKNSDLYMVNFTDIPLKEFYDALLAANRELIHDHYNHTGGAAEEAESLISAFSDLYSGKTTKFRGARVKSFEPET